MYWMKLTPNRELWALLWPQLTAQPVLTADSDSERSYELAQGQDSRPTGYDIISHFFKARQWNSSNGWILSLLHEAVIFMDAMSIQKIQLGMLKNFHRRGWTKEFFVTIPDYFLCLN